MKRGNVHRGINLLLAVMLLALGRCPVGAVSAQGPRFPSAGERAPQADATDSIRYVKPNGSTTGECHSWGTACDLQTALAAAISGDELWVAGGVYTPGASGVVTATFQLKDGVKIYGGFVGDEIALGQRNWTDHPTILSGDIDQNDVTESGVVTNTARIEGENAYHVVSANGITNTTLLDGFTITAGYNDLPTTPDQGGGGMYAVNSKITLRNVTFRGNYAAAGGGLFINGGPSGQPELDHVVLFQNYASINGGGLHTYNGSSPSLTYVTFSGNSADQYGGGMYNNGSSPNLTDVTFSDNKATTGGGMANENGSNPSLSHVTFMGNSTNGGAGGGMFNDTSSSPSLSHVTFYSNSTTYSGGGMANWGSSPILTDVTFYGNSTGYSWSGGGMFNNGGSPILTDVTFSDNMAWYGGGMFNNGGGPILTDVTFSGNRAWYSAGGMDNGGSSSSLTNVTFYGNWAGEIGGGMSNGGGSSSLTNVTFSGNWAGEIGGGMYNISGSSPILTNAILWGNTPDQIYNISSTPTIAYSDIQLQAGEVYTGTGNINLDPLFVDATSGNLRLQSTSPAIDAGDNAAPGLAGITTDLDGNPRFVDVPGVPDTGSGSAPIVDMGAYETQIAPTITTQPQSQTIASGQTATLTVVASGSSLSYQWYQGVSGDTSIPVGTDSDIFTTPALTSDTSYWVRVSNPAGSVDSETATITVVQPPTITSANSATFTEEVASSFTVTTAAGVPPATTISESGALPGGVSFTDNVDGTATLSGTPASGTSGTYHLTITASNGIPPDATQDFTLNILPAPLPYTYTFLPLLARH